MSNKQMQVLQSFILSLIRNGTNSKRTIWWNQQKQLKILNSFIFISSNIHKYSTFVDMIHTSLSGSHLMDKPKHYFFTFAMR